MSNILCFSKNKTKYSILIVAREEKITYFAAVKYILKRRCIFTFSDSPFSTTKQKQRFCTFNVSFFIVSASGRQESVGISI